MLVDLGEYICSFGRVELATFLRCVPFVMILVIHQALKHLAVLEILLVGTG